MSEDQTTSTQAETQSDPAAPDAKAQPGTAPETNPDEKLLKQAEVDDIVRRVKAREYRKREKLSRELAAIRSVHAAQPADAKSGAAKVAPQRNEFDDFEDYIAARAAYAAEEAVAKRMESSDAAMAEEAARESFDSLSREWDKRKEEGRKKYADFDDLDYDDIPMTPAMQRSVMESPIGHEVAYFLGKHPEEAERISELGLAAQIRAIGRLEERLEQTLQKKPKEPGQPIETTKARQAAQDLELHPSLSNEEWNRRYDLRRAAKARAQAGR